VVVMRAGRLLIFPTQASRSGPKHRCMQGHHAVSGGAVLFGCYWGCAALTRIRRCRGCRCWVFSRPCCLSGSIYPLSNIPPAAVLVSASDPRRYFIVITVMPCSGERLGGVWLDVLIDPGPRGACSTWHVLRCGLPAAGRWRQRWVVRILLSRWRGSRSSRSGPGAQGRFRQILRDRQLIKF